MSDISHINLVSYVLLLIKECFWHFHWQVELMLPLKLVLRDCE